ncbi:hypothetical protein [uncultured Dokdonia sp.]|uniref:hypothetical protein n=1 Tax=uncultured Dokdonia sp. TaxID=575653 RepID=UPI00262385FA|nr:hypothetical protein [uncultured Dokdonia sp.]
MSYYIHTTQTPNILFDHLLKRLTSSELKVLLTVIRKTIGQTHPTIPGTRLERAWISQKLFMLCCNLSGRAVSNAIDSLVQQKLLLVTDKKGTVLGTKAKRRGASQLYFSSLLRLEQQKEKTRKGSCYKPVTKGHTIKLNNKTKSCYNTSQGARKLSDTERYQQIKNTLPINQ